MKPVERKTSETIERMAVRILKMPYPAGDSPRRDAPSTFGGLLLSILGDDVAGRKKTAQLCQLIAVAALDTLTDPPDEIISGMLGRSFVPNKMLARSLFKSGIDAALGRNLGPMRDDPNPIVASQAASGAL